MKKKLIGANFKMNKGINELNEYFENFLAGYSPSQDVEVVIAPQMASLSYANKFFAKDNLLLGSQNARYENSGAFTGESSLSLLKEIGVKYVIVGHGERRNIFGESDELVNKKVLAILAAGLKPILCVGEQLSQRENNETEKILEQQLIVNLKGVDDLSLVDVAYEPIWAIGTGKTPTIAEIEAAHTFIRKFVSQESRILYGGSSNENNAAEFISIPNVDGFLVGGASLDANKFLQMIESMK